MFFELINLVFNNVFARGEVKLGTEGLEKNVEI